MQTDAVGASAELRMVQEELAAERLRLRAAKQGIAIANEHMAIVRELVLEPEEVYGDDLRRGCGLAPAELIPMMAALKSPPPAVESAPCSATPTALPSGLPGRRHALENGTSILPQVCQRCHKMIGFKKPLAKCTRCHLVYHQKCQGDIRSDCQAPGTPGNKKRAPPQPWTSLSAAVEHDSATGTVPGVVEATISAVHRRGLSILHIYHPMVRSDQGPVLLKRYFGVGTRPNFSTVASIHDVASTLVTFLAGLDEPMLTFELYPALIACQQARQLPPLLLQLPLNNFCTVKLLLTHLQAVRAHAEVNAMSEDTLLDIFSPFLLQSSESAASQAHEAPRRREVRVLFCHSA